ncbi:MAG: serine/threonine protein kinase [Planctomycetes bacterium]|nr:serine/threonine protein kinase [Planctomycetota bacterium]
MSSPAESPEPQPPTDRHELEARVAACIEALERGQADPVAAVCADRPDLQTRVQRRLSQLAAAGLLPAAPTAPPTAIGPYRIVRELGSGGMGSVWLAEQQQPVRREVALKVVKLGMDTREVLARFAAERQALARMSHPHIAQVFDAGTTPEGRPFFVMEYVAGQALTTFCDQQRLGTGARARLVATVCRAVQHAHDRGFLHRDLKPGNVLVAMHGTEAVPKVIDFGIAKATEAADAATALHTRHDQILGTPEYMSPEQMRSGGLDVDTRTDVYSLGVMLYELLCSELPFDSRRLRRATRHEMERIVTDELPTLPSRRLAAAGAAALAARGGDRDRLRRHVAGELDWITLKAIAKNRDDRYPSALALAEDIDRWLRHEPVLAAPPGRTYRLRKFVRRHRLALGATALVFGSLATALFTSLSATRSAVAARADIAAFYGLARDAIGNLVDTADEQLASLPQADAVRRRMLADAIGFYEALRARQPEALELRVDLVAANQRIGVLQHRLGQSETAIATLQQCATDLQALREEAPREARLQVLAVAVADALARALAAAGRDDASRRATEAALAALAAARRDGNAAAFADIDHAEAMLLANLALREEHDLPRALQLYEQALAAHARTAAPNARQRREQARCAGLAAEALTRAGRTADAAAVLARSVASLQALDPAAAAPLREAEAQVQAQFAAVLQRLDRSPEARAALERAIALHHALAEEHPDLPGHADDEAAAWHALAQSLEAAADLPGALAAIEHACTIRAALAERHPTYHRLVMRHLRSLQTKVALQMQMWQSHGADVAPAAATLVDAVQRADALQQANPQDVEIAITFAGIHATQAALWLATGRRREALREHETVRGVLTALLPQHPNDVELAYHLAVVHNNLLQAHVLLGEPARAVGHGRFGIAQVDRGLLLDARHGPLRDLAPLLLGRLATAQFAAGDAEGGMATLLRMCDGDGRDADTREQGALLLAGQLEGDLASAELGAWRNRTVERLRSAIAARGSLADALARPAQRAGYSHHGSRLRDFDLRLALANLLGRLQQTDAQAAVLDEAIALGADLDVPAGSPQADLARSRLRNLGAQRAELALARGDAGAAAAALDAMLAQLGPAGGGNYVAAVLFTRCLDWVPNDPAAQERFGASAVEALRLALDHGEVPAEAAQHPNFAAIAERPEYQVLLDR